MELIFLSLIEERTRARLEEKGKAIMANLSEEKKLDNDYTIKYKTIKEVISNKWLLHFAFHKLLAEQFSPVFTEIFNCGKPFNKLNN